MASLECAPGSGPRGGPSRVARGLTLSAACLAVPTIAHVMAGGSIPTAGPFLFAAGLLSTACVALADQKVSVRGIAALLFTSQPVFHVLFSLSAHGHGIDPAASGIGMVLGHAVAAGALTLLLAGGESVLWSMAALTAVLVRRQVQPAPLPVGAQQTLRPFPHPDGDRRSRYVLSITRAAPRRGPPLLSQI